MLRIWADHFIELSKSKINDCEGLQHLNDKVQSLYNASLSNEEYLPDSPLTIEESEKAFHKLKMRKACGLDGLLAEHLKFGRQAILKWLLKINSIVELEALPDILERGSSTPVYSCWSALQKSVEVAEMVFQHCLNDCYGLSIS